MNMDFLQITTRLIEIILNSWELVSGENNRKSLASVIVFLLFAIILLGKQSSFIFVIVENKT